jgi:hypothetical protein
MSRTADAASIYAIMTDSEGAGNAIYSIVKF